MVETQELKEIAVTQYDVPDDYSLSNKLLYICVHDFVRTDIINDKVEIFNISKINRDLSSLLFKHFKYSFTKIELTLEDTLLKGLIEYTDDLPIRFELQLTKQKNKEND